MYLGNGGDRQRRADLQSPRPLFQGPAVGGAAPRPGGQEQDRVKLQGDIPTPMNKPSGCGYAPAARSAKPSCAEDVPELRDLGGGQLVACPYA
ncbi:MAG: hypothetical protein R3E96_06500 [Planctomycetota bacterium]